MEELLRNMLEAVTLEKGRCAYRWKQRCKTTKVPGQVKQDIKKGGTHEDTPRKESTTVRRRRWQKSPQNYSPTSLAAE